MDRGSFLRGSESLMDTTEKLGRCLDAIRIMHQTRMVAMRPRSHRWYKVGVEIVLASDVDDDRLEIVVTETDVRSGKQVRENVIYSAEGRSLKALVEEAVRTLERAIHIYMRDSGGVKKVTAEKSTSNSVYFQIQNVVIEVGLPPGCWLPVNMFSLAKVTHGLNN